MTPLELLDDLAARLGRPDVTAAGLARSLGATPAGEQRWEREDPASGVVRITVTGDEDDDDARPRSVSVRLAPPLSPERLESRFTLGPNAVPAGPRRPGFPTTVLLVPANAATNALRALRVEATLGPDGDVALITLAVPADQP